jgi:hypothetical protein
VSNGARSLASPNNTYAGGMKMDMYLMSLVSEAFDRYNATANKKDKLDWKKDIIERIRYMQTEDEVKMLIEELKEKTAIKGENTK